MQPKKPESSSHVPLPPLLQKFEEVELPLCNAGFVLGPAATNNSNTPRPMLCHGFLLGHITCRNATGLVIGKIRVSLAQYESIKHNSVTLSANDVPVTDKLLPFLQNHSSAEKKQVCKGNILWCGTPFFHPTHDYCRKRNLF